MPERQRFRQFDKVAFQWRALAERRRAYFVELQDSGRWRHYYSDEEFLVRMREVTRTAESWAQIVPSPAEMLKNLAHNAETAPPETKQGRSIRPLKGLRRTA